jgi:gas vesicle protein
MKKSDLKQLIKEEIMISFQEGRKIKDSFKKLISDINSSQFVKLSQESLDALKSVGDEIEKLKS